MSHCSGEIFDVKSTELSQSEFLQKEQKILSTLNSPYIVGYKGDITFWYVKPVPKLQMLVDQAKWNGGTPMYMAPEVARGEEHGFPADIWALGCISIEMDTGGSPWTNVDNPASLLYHIAFSGQTPEIPKFLSSQARNF
ncbi:hypothetical protein K7X08_026388 [Anisodus acutangulus]|uniref:Protein kinase domain-containing protein n=1 Tax=Anisodus acutangulus TaxID=402998 RepID=A0A9Q1LNT3_9SOLA|nr:hypothetical protein K7X08_026388 [Anisodus acutangulus]